MFILLATVALVTMKLSTVCLTFVVVVVMLYVGMVHGGHYIIPGAMPYDAYHDLHLPHHPPLYPTHAQVPRTSFTCHGRAPGYYADIEAACQAYHLCEHNHSKSFLCTNGTLFNEQFQVCDQFYNVRCGSPYEDLK